MKPIGYYKPGSPTPLTLEQPAGLSYTVVLALDADREIQRLKAEVEELRAWRERVFLAHPNVDMDIEAVERIMVL